MQENNGDFDALIQGKIDGDADFIASVDGLEESEREIAINNKKQELIKEEIKILQEKALKASKAEELANNYKARAEKAENKLKENGEPEAKIEGITPKDVLVLSGAGITHEEDVAEVEKWAKFHNIPISQAIKDSTLQIVLNTKKEHRATELATNTRGGRQGVSNERPETILSKARSGQVGESDEDIERLVDAEHAIKVAKLKR